jgi:hypothetical protein
MVRAFLVAGARRLTNTASYGAWIRNNGTHSTKTVGYKCWNTELIENANVILGPQWTSLDDKIAIGIEWYLAMVEKSMKKTTENAASTSSSRARVAALHH